MESSGGHIGGQFSTRSFLTWILFLCNICGFFCFNLNTHTPDIYSSTPSSGFGFSVTQFAINNSKWLIIGAPFEQGDVTQDGAVYRCARRRCERMTFNTYGSSRTNSSYSMIGASVTASQIDGLVIACAPRYSYYEAPFFSGEDDAIYMMGACFVYDGKTDSYLKKPFTPCMPGTNGIQAINKQCAAGLSVSVIEGEDAFVIGAVGTHDYRGQYIRMEISRRRYPDYGLTGSEEGDYCGYGVETGRFSNENVLDMVAGAPRAKEHLGEVILYKRLISKGWEELERIGGRQFGEYFGSVLAVGDLNGDKLDDLVVGAPFHANDNQKVAEVGKVYVFYQNKRAARKAIFTDHVTELQGDVTKSGRFGFSVSVLHDVDQDGFNDLAVGAPLEGGAGVVHLFLGSPAGVSKSAFQIIHGSASALPPLAMFGSALSGILDIDGNGYPDLLVGASGSGHSLLFRTHPVLTVDLQLTTDISYIKLEDLNCDVTLPPTAITCFRLTTILSYGGKNVLDKQSLQLTWILNSENTKPNIVLFIEGNSSQKQTNFTETLLLGKGIPTIRTHTVFVTNAIVEFIPPVNIQINYQLATEPFDLSEPVLDAKIPSLKVTQVKVFRPPADVSLKVESTSPQAILGRGQLVEFIIKVNNTKEVPCYNVDVNITLPKGVSFSSVVGSKSVTCLLPENKQPFLICSLGFRFPSLSQTEFRLRTSINNQSLVSQMTSLNYSFNLTSANDINSANNIDFVNLELISKTEVEISGLSTPDQLQVTETSEDQNVTHVYKFINHGPSDLVAMEIWITWPVMTSEGVPLLRLDDSPEIDDEKGTCHTEEHTLAPVKLSQLEFCSPETKDLLCQKLHCLTESVDGGDSVVITIRATLLPDIIKLSEFDNSLVLNSTVKVDGKTHPGIPLSGSSTDHVMIQTKIHFPGVKREEKVSWWIYIVASCCGLLLLVVLVVVLWKLKFFRRGTRERLYSAKRESNNLNWPQFEDDTDDGAICPMVDRVGDAGETSDVNTSDEINENEIKNNDENMQKEFDECLSKLREI